ncbi:MAG: hypothetical protein ACOVMM_04805 [Chitinophagaceae bacterium]
MIKKFDNILFQLQQENKRAVALAFIRVAISFWFIKELFFRYPAFEVLYSSNSYLKVNPEPLIKELHLNINWLQLHYPWVIAVCVLTSIIHILGIGKNLGSIAMFFCYSVLRAMNASFGNTGDEVCFIISFYLCFANSFEYATLFKYKSLSPKLQSLYNLVSNLAAISLMVNLCMAYFYTGYFKLENKLWQQGIGLQYSLYNERFHAFDYPKLLATKPWFYIPLNYIIILFEVTMPFLVWFKKWRNKVLFLMFLMHVYIYCTMLIFGMTFTFLLQYPIFYKNDELKAFFIKLKYTLFYTKASTN